MIIYELVNGRRVVDVEGLLDLIRITETDPEIPVKLGATDYEALWKSLKRLLEFELMTTKKEEVIK